MWPLHDRLEIVYEEQQILNERLQAPETVLEQRVMAYRSWKVLERERLNLEASIKESRRLAESPFIMFIFFPPSDR